MRLQWTGTTSPQTGCIKGKPACEGQFSRIGSPGLIPSPLKKRRCQRPSDILAGPDSVVRTFEGPAREGLNRVAWDLKEDFPRGGRR